MIPFSKPVYYGNEVEYVTDAVQSTWISDGEYIDRLEKMLIKILNVKYAITTSNGTSALMLAYLTLGLGRGDEVIVPGFCFQAAANVAIQLGIKPIFADVDIKTFNIDHVDVERKITNKTRAIVLVHNYGNPVDITAFIKLRDKYNLFIIEDCAESLFSFYEGRYCGTFGDISTFSFHATKTVTTGEGGAVITNNRYLAEEAALIKNHGLAKRGTYNHIIPGNNFRMTNMQAAIGVAQLESSHTIFTKKINIILDYYKAFVTSKIKVQKVLLGAAPIFWSLAIKFPKHLTNEIEILRNLYSIETRPGFTSASEIPYFNTGYLKNSYELSKTVLVLPCYTSLSDSDIDYITNSIISLGDK